jgi:thioredoxin reductase (NADPH)
MTQPTDEVVDHRPLIITGSGIAGLSAAIYAGRSNNDPLVFEGDEPGGQLTLKSQAERFGAEIKNGAVEDVTADDRPFTVRLTNGDVYTADAVIAASGASARTLGIPGEDDLMGYGLSTCATCDGAFFRGEEILVVGGGDAAMEEANFLTKFASTVYIAHRREEFRAEDYWIDRVTEKVDDGEIEIMRNTEVTELHGSKEDGLDHVTLVSHPEGYPTDKLDDPDTETVEFDAGAVFYAIGHTPNTEYLEGTGVDLDDAGYLHTQGGTWSITTTSRRRLPAGWA